MNHPYLAVSNLVAVAITDVAELVITVDELVVAITFDIDDAAPDAVDETTLTCCSYQWIKKKH